MVIQPAKKRKGALADWVYQTIAAGNCLPSPRQKQYVEQIT
jgi:hypothetical protein